MSYLNRFIQYNYFPSLHIHTVAYWYLHWHKLLNGYLWSISSSMSLTKVETNLLTMNLSVCFPANFRDSLCGFQPDGLGSFHGSAVLLHTSAAAHQDLSWQVNRDCPVTNSTQSNYVYSLRVCSNSSGVHGRRLVRSSMKLKFLYQNQKRNCVN